MDYYDLFSFPNHHENRMTLSLENPNICIKEHLKLGTFLMILCQIHVDIIKRTIQFI